MRDIQILYNYSMTVGLFNSLLKFGSPILLLISLGIRNLLKRFFHINNKHLLNLLSASFVVATFMALTVLIPDLLIPEQIKLSETLRFFVSKAFILILIKYSIAGFLILEVYSKFIEPTKSKPRKLIKATLLVILLILFLDFFSYPLHWQAKKVDRKIFNLIHPRFDKKAITASKEPAPDTGKPCMSGFQCAYGYCISPLEPLAKSKEKEYFLRGICAAYATESLGCYRHISFGIDTGTACND
jgi:hypothetical protein